MSLLRRAIASVLSGVLAFGQPAEVLAASYVFRQASTAGTFPVPTITNNVVTAATYYKIDGRSYSISWQGTGGRSPYQLEMVGSPLPPGCTTPIQTGSILTANCVFTTEGNFGGVMAQLTDANGMVVRDNAPNIVVTAPAPTLNTYSFPFSGYVATPYKGSLKVSGGRQPFNASRATGQLPPGLSLAMVQDVNTGAWSVELSGTPTTLGSYTFDILLTDANQKQVTSSKINVSVGFGPVSLALRPSTPTGVFKVMAGQPIGNAGVSIVGGTPPISLSQQTGVLPIGLSIGSDGRLVGTPTVVGTTSGIQIRAVDAATPSRTATSAAFTVQVVNGLSATVISGNAPYLVNQPISPITTVPNGGTGPYSYSLAGDLPPGISFSKTNGQFTGTPTVAGRYPGLVVTVRDADGFTTDAAAFAMTVANPLTIAGDAPRGVAGNPYTATFTASGGTGPYGFTLASGDLPFGLSLASDGTISGTPFVAGTTDGLVVRVTDANGSTKDKGPFSIVLADALAVATTPARSATRGVAYSSAFTAAGGTAPYGFALVSGTLPPGLSLATGGTVSGTPTTVGSYGPLTVRLVDAEGHTATGETTIVVSAPVAIAGSAGRGTLGQPYAAAFTATGGAGPYAFSLAAGALPLGLSLASDGTISGTPTAAGTAAGIVVRVADADGRTDQTQAFSIVVDAPLRIAGTPSAVATLGQTYSASFAASGGTGPYTFALATGTLPAGLALAGSGTITGAPTTTGVSENLSVKVTDAAGRTVSSETFRIAVGTVLAVSGSASTLATAGQAYAAQFAAAGGSAPYAWTLASGTLPPGLSLDSSTGLVGGTPTTLGSYPGIQVRASDADGRTALSSIFGISVSSSLAISGAPSVSATVGQPYSAQFTATGGAGTKTFSLATGQLPAGLSFDTATGLISGTPTTKGFSPSIAVRVRDETNSAATAQAFDLYVSDPLVVSGIPTPDAIVGAAYSGNAAVAGGRPAYAWTLDAGTLPPGLQLSAVTGVVSGTPTTPGTTSGLRLRATDVDGRTGVTAAFAITVAAPLTIAGQAGPGTVGAAYAATFAADGGTLPYSYEIVGAALPAGLTLDAATGTISGQPTAASAGGTMQMRVTDAKGRTASTASFAIDVRDPFRLVGSNLGPATIGLAYSGVMAPAGGRGPFVLSLAAGSLPPGLTLEPGTGVIAGTPTAPGSYAGIVIAGVDADGRTARSAAFTIEVADGISIAGIPPQPATVGVPYDFAFTARGGQAPYTFALTGGNLPGGMTLDGGTGGMGGSPNRAGIVTNLTVTAMDRARRTAASLPFTIDVRDPVSVSGTPPLVATTGRPYTASFAAVGGRGPFAFAMVGTLPAGLTLNATSGTITGSATTVDDVAGLRVRATDQDGRVGISDPFAISVAAPLTLAGTPSPSADVGAPYAAKFTAAGGKQPYAFAVKAGILPTGLVLDPAGGGIDGTPNATGTFPDIQIQVVDANGTTTVSQSFTVVVSDPLSAIVQVGPGTVGQTYAGLVATTGGRGPFSYALAAGTLPAGLQIDAVSGRISGTPRSAGVAANLQIRVSDADARSVLTSSFSISVSAPLTLAGLGIPSALATLGRTYDSAVTANGGQGPYSYTLSEGVLPAGLTLDGSSGRISGTPTVVGAAEGLRISASDSEGRAVASSVFHIDVRDPVVLTGDPADFGTIGQTYAASFAASGGRGPYSFSLVGTLPAGLGLNASTGAVAGIPTRVGDASGLQIRAVDQDGRVGISRAFDIHISPSLSIVGSLPPAATVGLAYAGGYTGRDGSGPYSFALVAGALPDGLSFDAETGQVSGTPNAIGTSAGLQVRVTDRNGRVATAPAVSIIVSDPLVASISPSPAIRNVAFSAQVATTGGRGPLGFTLSAGALPAGLTLNAGTGVIGGTPTTVQVASGLQVRVTDADGRAVSTQTFSISVAPALTLALSSNLPGTIGTAFSAQATAAGGRPTYAYAVTAGSLPPGLQLDEATGRISGTPSAIGRTAITITTTDADGRSAQASSTIAVAEPLQLVVRASDTPATVGQAFNQTFVGVGGRATYVYAVTGTLPPGLTLNASTGVLAGTPTTAGLYGNLVIRVTDADGRSQSSAAFAIDVRAAMAFSGTGVPSGIATVGLSYASSVSAAGGRSPYRYTVAAGTLPAGLVLDGSIGQIAGTPTQVETATGLRIAVSDADGRSFVGPVFQIDVRQPVVVAGAAASIGTISQTYGPHAFAAAGGRGPYTYAMVGTLPAGLSLSSSGTLSGTPSATGSFSGLQVRATDADGRTGLSSQFAIIVSRALTISSNTPTAATVGTSYSGSYTAANGRQPYVFGVAAGTLPSGLSIDPASGQIAGTPTTAGTFPGIQVRVTDVDGRNATAAAVAIIVSNPLSASASPTPAVRSSAYSTQIAVQGGRSNYSYVLASGTLPAGLTLGAATGTISGTPTTQQVASGLQVRVTDADGRTTLTPAFTISVAPPLSLSLANPIQATVGAALSNSANPAGGRPPYAVSLSSGALPPGISLDAATGAIAGTTSSTGTFAFAVTAMDADARNVSASSSIVVQAPVSVGPPTNTDGMIGTIFSASVSTSGGSGSYTFALAAGSLPPGLSLNAATGAIGGTPTTAGSFQGIQIRATDGAGRQGTSPASVITIDSVMSISGSLANSSVGASYGASIVAQGGRAPYGYALAAGTLPPGLGLNGSTGSVAGTTTTAGTYSGIQIRATDALGRSATTGSLSMQVFAPLAIVGTPNGTATRGTGYSSGISGTGGRAPYAFSVASGSLPSGLTLSSSGSITGTPNGSGGTFSVNLRDADGRVVTSPALTISVADPLNLSVSSQSYMISPGDAFAAHLIASGGAGPYSYAVQGGALPPGLSLNVSGAEADVAGRPANGGVSRFVVVVTDAGGRTATAPVVMSVAQAVAPGIGTFTFAGAYELVQERGRFYRMSNPVVGGQAPYRFEAPNGMPAGLTLNPETGEITGVAQTPNGPNDYVIFPIYATDAIGRVANTEVTTSWRYGFALQVISQAAEATVGRVYPGTVIQARDGNGPYRIQVQGLPPGLVGTQISGDLLLIVGTPTSAGRYSPSCTATDRTGASTSCIWPSPASITVADDVPTTLEVLAIRAGTGENAASGKYASYLHSSMPLWNLWKINRPVWPQSQFSSKWLEIEYPETVRVNGIGVASTQFPGFSADSKADFGVTSDNGSSANAKWNPSTNTWALDRTLYGRKFRISLRTYYQREVAAAYDLRFGTNFSGDFRKAMYVGTKSNIPVVQMRHGSQIDHGATMGTIFSTLRPNLYPPGFRWVLDTQYPLPPGLTFNPTTGRVTGTINTTGAAKGEYRIWVYGTDDYGRIWDTQQVGMNIY